MCGGKARSGFDAGGKVTGVDGQVLMDTKTLGPMSSRTSSTRRSDSTRRTPLVKEPTPVLVDIRNRAGSAVGRQSKANGAEGRAISRPDCLSN